MLGVPAHQPRPRNRGGDEISTPRATRAARLGTAAGALALAAALGVTTAFDTEQDSAVLAGAAAAAVLLSLGLAAARSAPIPSALLLLGAIYAIPDGDRAIAAPFYGSGLLLTAELAYWSLDERIRQRVDVRMVTPRLLAILAVSAAALPASALVLVAAEVDVGRSPAITAAGAAAAAACVGLLAALARFRSGETTPP